MNNKIHPTAIIDENVEIGSNNIVEAFCILKGPLKLGDNNHIFPHVTIGTPGQDTRNPRYDASVFSISIGNNNLIREYTAIQKPCYEKETVIGSDVFIMQGVHIPHDAKIEDKVVITPNCAFGGLVKILKGANIAIGVTVAQRVVIGQYCIAAMGSAVVKNIRPFSKFIPGKPISVNHYAIEKFGFGESLGEITKYVIDGSMPSPSSPIYSIVNSYIKMSRASGLSEYV